MYAIVIVLIIDSERHNLPCNPPRTRYIRTHEQYSYKRNSERRHRGTVVHLSHESDMSQLAVYGQFDVSCDNADHLGNPLTHFWTCCPTLIGS